MQLSGKLEDLGLGEIFQILSFSAKSGVLRIRNARSEGYIIFKDGAIVKAWAEGMKEGVCEALFRKKIISELELKEARKRQKAKCYTELLGRILVKEFHIPQEGVDNEASALIEKAVHAFFRWSQGHFEFELTEYHETPELIQSDVLQYTLKKGLNPQFLAMEGLRLLDESSRDRDAAETPSEAHEEDGQAAASASELLDHTNDAAQPNTQACPSMSDRHLAILNDMLEELSRPMTFNEIVLLILRFTSELISRSVVFTVKEDVISGFGQFGIEIEGDSADHRVRKMKIPSKEPSILKEALECGKIVNKKLSAAPWNEYMMEQLGGHRPAEALAAPLLVQGRVALILYGDNVPEPKKLDCVPVLEAFLSQISMALERDMDKENIGAACAGAYARRSM